MKKRSSLLAVLLAASLSFTSIAPALAAEAPEGGSSETAVELQEETPESGEETSEGFETEIEVESDAAEAGADAADTADDNADAQADTEAAEADADGSEAEGDTQEPDAQEANEQEADTEEDAAEDAAEAGVVTEETEETAEAEEETAEPNPAEFTGAIYLEPEMQTGVPTDTSQSSDDLFEAYVDRAFEGVKVGPSIKAKKTAGSKLTGFTGGIYTYIAGQLPAIAAGQQASTAFSIGVDDLGVEQTSWTAAELGVDSLLEQDSSGNWAISSEAVAAVNERTAFDVPAVVDALLADFPYELYWFDKTSGYSYSTGFPKSVDYDYSLGDYVIYISGSIAVNMAVADEYAVSGSDYTVDTAIGQSVQTSVANAHSIVSKYSSYEDYDKLCGYRDDICDLVSYNDDATADGYPYGNPWQLIWVFDGDDTTNVVCEGYSKAFKYLCDETSFDTDIGCITVSGTMSGGTGAGPHMWNVVSMDDGLNYVVDVTNCDEGTIGAPDQLFMCPVTYTGDYQYQCECTYATITYVYDSDTIALYDASDLLISETAMHTHVWSDEYTVDQAATCSEEGIESIHCTICGCVKPGSERTIEKLAHNYGDWETVTEPTCTSAGSRKKTCTVCNDEVVEEIAMLAHDLSKTDAAAATCTEAGHSEYWTCSMCGKIFSDSEGTTEITLDELTIPATGHTLNKTDAVAATCTEEGRSEYWTCSECGKIFADSEGTIETTLEQLAIPATGHTLNKTDAVAATCTEAGHSEYWTCSNCGKIFSDSEGTTETTLDELTIPATGHALNKTDAVAATCTENGHSEYWTCSNCGKIFADSEGTTETTVEQLIIYALGHTFDKTEAVEPTCTEAGHSEYWTCNACGKIFADSEGTTETTLEELTILALGHTLNKTDAVAATCTEEGRSEYWTCSECGKIFADSEGVTETTEDDVVVPATGHDWSDWVVVTPATEEAEGLERRVCNNDSSHVEERAIPKLSHVHTLTKVEAVDATCTSDGNVEYWICSGCNKIYLDEEATEEADSEDIVIPATGHNMVKTDAVAATCTEAGHSEYWTCSECGKIFADSEGTTETTLDELTIPAPGHEWSDWVVTKEPTATEEGLRERRCATCDEIQTEVIPRTVITLDDSDVPEMADMTYTGEALTQSFEVVHEGNVLTQEVDYTVAYADNVNAGTATVTVTGIGAYTGEVVRTFTIAPKKVTPAVTLAKTVFVYSGKAFKPGVTVKVGGTKLATTSYTVSYQSGRKNVGKYKVVVNLKGNYTGNKTVYFKINPKGTAIASLAPASKKMTVKWKKQATQTSGYQIQVATNSGFTANKKTVTVSGASKVSKVITGLKGGKKYYVRIRTYKVVSGVKYYSTWSAKRTTTVKK